MSVFDARVSVHSASIGTPSDEALEAGHPPTVEMALTLGMGLPFQNPETGEALVVPFGTQRFEFTKEQAMELFHSALEAAEKLPDTPQTSGKLITASNMAQAEQAAKRLNEVTGG